MTDYPSAIPMFVNESRVFIDSNHPKWIVLHKTAGFKTAQQVAQYFATNQAMASTHYVVGRDGAVVQCVWEKDGAGGNCCLEQGHASYLPTGVNLNMLTISIEHVDPAPDNSTPLTAEQKAASFSLINWICNRHNIPKRSGDAAGGVIGHRDLDPISRARCPGNYPWSELFAFLAQGGSMLDIPASRGFFVDLGNDVWRCTKTGYMVGHGILGFYRSYGGDALNGLTYIGLPLSNEIEIAGYKGVVYQRFERGVVCWDPGHEIDNPPDSGPAYMMHIDKGIGQDPRVAALQQQVATLQQQLAALQHGGNGQPGQSQGNGSGSSTTAASEA